MANQEELDLWILKNAQFLNLEIEELDWTKNLKSPLYDFNTIVRVEGEKFYGRGTDKFRDLALKKSIAEAVERSIIKELKLNSSNGVAVNTDVESAKASALFELVERHIFLSYFISCTPFSKLNKNEISCTLTKDLIDFVESKDGTISISILQVKKVGYFCLASVHGLKRTPSFGLILGSSFSKCRSDAELKAVVESVRTFAHVSSLKKVESINEREFLDLTAPTFEDHGKLALNIDYANKINEKLFCFSVTDRNFLEVEIKHIEYNIFDCKNSSLKIPLYLVRSSGDSFQNLFSGATKPNLINKKAIESLIGKFTPNFEVHPFR